MQQLLGKCDWEYQHYTDQQLLAMFNVTLFPQEANNPSDLVKMYKQIHNFVYLTRDDQINTYVVLLVTLLLWPAEHVSLQ